MGPCKLLVMLTEIEQQFEGGRRAGRGWLTRSIALSTFPVWHSSQYRIRSSTSCLAHCIQSVRGLDASMPRCLNSHTRRANEKPSWRPVVHPFPRSCPYPEGGGRISAALGIIEGGGQDKKGTGTEAEKVLVSQESRSEREEGDVSPSCHSFR